MPPKKGTGESAVVAILKEANVQNAKQITDSTLRKIYKLEDDILAPRDAGSSSRGIDSFLTRPRIHDFKACDNAWDTSEKRKEALTREAARTSKSGQNKKLRHAPAENKDGQPVLDPSCSLTNCRDNPRCVNWLGQHLWEDDMVLERFAKQWGLSDNPMHEVRDPELPVGLKNLGATCYVNSYLQVWYQNEPFRRAVFSCALDPTKDLEKQPLYHLQVIFAALQEARMKAFNPVDLVKSLDIDTSDQQDAQEFAKLLMTLLENEFAKQRDPALKTLIARQFEGKIKYGTRCRVCKNRSENTSSFKELEVPLKNHRSLQEQLKKSLDIELLTDENKYRCEYCKKLRDAERYTEIVQLPPVLHFSLMRFGYDFKANERKKSAASIEFPKSVDMSKFVEGSRGPEWYDLRGILIHKGTSAHHGHYVAQIRDAKFKQWFLFDDETVSKLELIKTPIQKPSKRARSATPLSPVVKNDQSNKQHNGKGKTIDLTSSDSESDAPYVRSSPYKQSSLEVPRPCGSSKSAAKKRKVEDDSDMEENRVATDDLIKSKDAYMLVYVRRDASDGLEVDPPAIPSVVQQKLQEIDRELTTRMEEYIAEETECHRKFKIKRDQKREIYRVWNEPSDTEEALLMDKDALSAWLTAELVPEKKQVKKAAKGEASKVNGKADASDSESDTVEVTSVRVSRTSPHESQAHMNGNGTTKHKGLWKESPVSGTRLASEEPAKQKSEGETDADEDLPDLAKIFSRSRPLASTNGNPASTDQSAVNGHAVSKDSLDHQEPAPPATQSGARRGKGMRQVRQIWSESLICSHGNVKPSAASQMKRISSTGVQLLAAADIDIRPQFVTPDNLCRQCVFEPIQSRTYKLQHKKDVEDFEALCTGQSNPSWVSKTWLDDWTKDKPSMHEEGSDTDPPPNDPAYLHQVLCEHGYLTPDEQGRVMITGRQTRFLQNLFPQWIPVQRDVEVCQDCREVYVQEARRKQEIKALASADKSNKHFRRLLSVPVLTKHEIVPTRADEEFRAVPKAWMNAWRDWVKKPSTSEEPHAIDLRPFLCEHVGLKFDFDFPDDRKNFEIVYEDEWHALKAIYKSKAGLELVVKQVGRGQHKTRPKLCEPCRKLRRLAFVKIEIGLKFLDKDEDMDAETDLPRAAFSVDDYEERERSPSPVGTSGTRRSTRQRRQPGSSLANSKKPQRRKPELITVKKLDTLKNIRIKIQELTDTPTLYQRIFFNNREIEDSSETVESIGITQGESLQVLLLDVPNEDEVDIGLFENSAPVSSRPRATSKDKPKSNGRPEGFVGTALSGLDARSDEARAAREREEAEILAAIPGRCRVCTYQNEAGVKRCEMCENDI